MLSAIENQLPSITKSASEAAQWYIEDESFGIVPMATRLLFMKHNIAVVD